MHLNKIKNNGPYGPALLAKPSVPSNSLASQNQTRRTVTLLRTRKPKNPNTASKYPSPPSHLPSYAPLKHLQLHCFNAWLDGSILPLLSLFLAHLLTVKVILCRQSTKWRRTWKYGFPSRYKTASIIFHITYFLPIDLASLKHHKSTGSVPFDLSLLLLPNCC